MIEIARSVAELRRRVHAWRAAGETVGLVPTMGSLHEGHLELVRHSRARAARTCVTLFVNPTQFGPNEDFQSYPRDAEGDAAKLETVGADLLYVPAADAMYPEGHATRVRVAGLGDVLEGEHRPGFFEGVATVVTKLLLRALPDFAVFGEKDYQQLRVIERLVSDLDIPVRIDSVAIVREPDGLALSSRNGYLTADERSLAPALYRAITVAAEAVAGGGSPAEQEEQARADLLSSGFAEVDYVAVRDAETLGPFDPARAGRVLAAARLGRARLIDNVPVP